jgi:very-short-patch-repair endonuclease
MTSDLERAFLTKLRQRRLPRPVTEYQAIPGRRFRIDCAYPDRKIAVELEGGVWSGGRHVRPKGFTTDCIKYNMLALHGWRVLRFTTEMVEDDSAIDMLEQVLQTDQT